MQNFLKKITFALLVSTSSTLANDRPNIIYINVDDLGWADVGYQGSKYYETPHIDKLASQGMIFTNAYAAAASCAPSRASALTGQAPPRHRIYSTASPAHKNSKTTKLIPAESSLQIKSNNLTLGHSMQVSDYITATIGKWQISENPLKNGFDINIAGSLEGGPYRGGYHSPYKYPNLENDKPGEYLTDRLTDEAIKLITQFKDTPLFLYISYFSVHSPIQAKAEKVAYYKKKQGNESQNDADYAAMISSLDDNIGRLMESLDALNLTNDTIVIFTSDNGAEYSKSKQTPLRAGKGSYYEGGIRVPLIIRWPGKVSLAKCHTPVSQLDFFPTFMELMHTNLRRKAIDGVSLMPLFQNKSITNRALYWHFPIYSEGGNKDTQDPIFSTRPGSAIREGDWKLIQYFENNDIELYNLKYDISEKNNLAKSYTAKAEELVKKLDIWRSTMKVSVLSKLNPDFNKDHEDKNSEEKKDK